MNREIKFRGKRLANAEWCYGSLLVWANGECTILEKSDSSNAVWKREVDPNTIGQFTGLCDKNGKEIYDGDIIKITGSNEAKHVAYSDKEAAFGIQYPDGDFFAFAYDVTGVSEACYEVIGNIHDNLELLKGGAK